MRSLQIQLSDSVYAAIASEAAAKGQSIEALVSDALEADFTSEVSAEFWTSVRLSEIDTAAVEARAGKSLTMEQVDDHFAAKREAWQQKHHA